jgi:hypothetical protein
VLKRTIRVAGIPICELHHRRNVSRGTPWKHSIGAWSQTVDPEETKTSSVLQKKLAPVRVQGVLDPAAADHVIPIDVVIETGSSI